MRIVVFHNQPPGGARRALAGLCTYLRQRHEVTLVALATADDEWVADRELGDRVQRIDYQPQPPKRGMFIINDLIRRSNLDRLDAANRQAATTIDEMGADVVLVDACRETLIPSALAHLQTPAVYYAHNGPAWLEEGRWNPPRTRYETMRDIWHGPFERRLTRRIKERQTVALKSADLVLANSAHTGRRLRRGFGVTAMTAPPGIDVPLELTHRRRSGVLSVGELETRKGFDLIVDAISQIPKERRPSLTIIAHRANALVTERLISQAKRAEVELHLRHDPPLNELWTYYESAAVFVYGAHHEALGLAPLEALARNCPVVAVGEGGLKETVMDGRTGFLISRQAQEFAAAIDDLLSNPAQAEAFGTAGRAAMTASWTWERRGPAIEAALASTAASSVGEAVS